MFIRITGWYIAERTMESNESIVYNNRNFKNNARLDRFGLFLYKKACMYLICDKYGIAVIITVN